MKPSYRFYRRCFRIARAIFGTLYRIDIKGKENVPEGAAMVCSNHSSLMDPVFIGLAFGIGNFMHFIAKVELFRKPGLSALITKLGAISVDRNIQDITTIKATLGYFKIGEKVAIFPEGRRVTEEDSVAAKSGAIKLAERAGVPLVPIFVPRKKRLFRKTKLVIGEPYLIEKQQERRTAEEYARLADVLMTNIEALNPIHN